MTRVVTTETVDPADVDRWLSPRDDAVLEQPVGDGVFECAEGPFTEYRRQVTVEPADDGRRTVTQTVEFRLAIPVWGWLFVGVVKRLLRSRPPSPGEVEESGVPWWSPPDRLTQRTATVLGLLAGISVVAGYLGTLLSQTITFAADEFGSSDTAQGVTLASVRIGILAALVLVALADRRGRRTMLHLSLIAGCFAAATTAFAPNLVFFGICQLVARAFSATAAVLIGIIAVEEMPRNSRAYAISVLAMSGALGAGMVLWVLPLADLADWAWRLIFLVPLLLVLVARALLRHLPESQRFVRAEATDLDDEAARTPEARRSHRFRLLLLGASGFLTQLFLAPSSQFFNEFLRDDRGFSALKITFFQIATNLPGGIGIVVGGKLADVRGRRIVGSIGLVVGVGSTVIMYNVFGWPMWAWSVLGSLIGAAVIPALGVYGPELFPTGMRGRANGILTVIGVAGASAGLLLAGWLSDQVGGLSETMVILAVGPAIVAVLVLALYPETAHLELEEINPEDRLVPDPPPAAPAGGEAAG
jgi:MFS family permease